MAHVDEKKVVELLKQIQADLRSILDDYAAEADTLAVNSIDPHTAIIHLTQMALVNAAADYMVNNGATAVEAFERVVSSTGDAMQAWVLAVAKEQGLKVTSKGVEIDKGLQ